MTREKYGCGEYWTTTIAVRESFVRCVAPGFAPKDVQISPSQKIRVTHFPFSRPQNLKASVVVRLADRAADNG